MHKCIFRLNFSYPVAEHYQPWGAGVGRGKRGNKNKKNHWSVCCLLFNVSSALKKSHSVCILGNARSKVKNIVYI